MYLAYSNMYLAYSNSAPPTYAMYTTVPTESWYISHSTDVIYLIYSKYRTLRFPYVRHLHGMHVSEGMRSHEARGKILFGGADCN